MSVDTVVFDIGNVLVDWQPHLAWIDELGTREAVEAFMERVDFSARNVRGDAGESFAEMALEIDDPDDRRRLASYVERYPLTVEKPVIGTWELLHRLKARDVPVHAITNWSIETWQQGLKAQPQLGEVFTTLIISGEVKLIKPDIRIFELFCARAGVAAADCVFIDDRQKNVSGARAAGMDAIHFTDAAALEAALIERGLL